MTPAELKERTLAFALGAIAISKQFPNHQIGWILSKQLVRSATSIGANYRAACRARSRRDFLSRLAIAEEEADESMYWLELAVRSGLVLPSDAAAMLREADELTAIFVASARTVKRTLGPGRGTPINPQSEFPNPQ